MDEGKRLSSVGRAEDCSAHEGKRHRVVGNYVTKARAVYDDLRECYKDFGAGVFGDASCFEQLRWPSVRRPEGTSGKHYFYSGRSRFPEVYASIPESEISLTGLPGSGKTVIAATLAGFLLVHRHEPNQRVVYVVGHQYALDPAEVLKEALALAYIDDAETVEELTEITELRDLVLFCQDRTERLIFMVDDWNELDARRDRHPVDPNRRELTEASNCHVLVKICSPTSEDARRYYLSLKRQPRIHFNDAFTLDELRTWMAGTRFSGLRSATPLLELYTGYMPRLLSFYVESTDLVDYEQRCSRYIMSINKFVNGLHDADALERAMRMAVGGVISVGDFEHVQWDWCYVVVVAADSMRVRLASDYLSMFMADAVLKRSRTMVMDSKVRTVWAQAVEADSNVPTSVNSARIGWNVEALVISLVKTRKELLGVTFSTWKHYGHDGELTALRQTTVRELLKGVLFVPLHFNETAVDLVVVKVTGESSRALIHGVQISVSTLKRKMAKDSHSRWRTEVAPQWAKGLTLVKEHWVDYTYVLPQSCLANLKDGVKVARFGEIDDVLSFVDNLALRDPVEPLVYVSGQGDIPREPRTSGCGTRVVKSGIDDPYFK